MQQLSLDETFIVSIWLEALIYGFFLCLFCASVYVNLSLRQSQNVHSKVMFAVGVVMFFIATLHVAMNCFRLIRGYITYGNAPGGPVGYIGDLNRWDHIFKDTLYATQEILGDAVAIYRCWILWNRNWKVVVLPCMLLICSIISGYSVCGLYSSIDPTETVFNPRLNRWIRTFYSIAVVQNVITTGLMAFRLWATERRTASYRTARGNVMPILRILVESAALQLFVEILLLSLYAASYNAQYILLEIVTPLVGITFNAITIRITLRSQGALKSIGGTTATESTQHHVETIGSIPMRHIAINITKDVHDHREEPDSFMYKQEQK